MCGESRGSVFQTGLPFRRESGGVENPRLLRDRPTGGAAVAVHNYVGFGALYADLCGY